MYIRNDTLKLCNQYLNQLQKPTITSTKYTGLHNFPIEYVDRNFYVEEDKILQSYSDGSKIIISNGKLSKILLTEIGCIDFTKKKLYGFYELNLFDHFKFYLESKSVLRTVKYMYETAFEKEFYLILKDDEIIKTPITDKDEYPEKLVHSQFYSSLLFWFVTLSL